jgi:UDP-N-acetylmuramoyl-L-alanyl-D-glutamate--2,6-diaminopimelate ligase
MALEQGAAAVLTDARRGEAGQAEVLADSESRWWWPKIPRAALACAAALWFGAQPEVMVAVTGTNGKTSVATFTRQIWAALGMRRSTSARRGSKAPGRRPRPYHAGPDHACTECCWRRRRRAA